MHADSLGFNRNYRCVQTAASIYLFYRQKERSELKQKGRNCDHKMRRQKCSDSSKAPEMLNCFSKSAFDKKKTKVCTLKAWKDLITLAVDIEQGKKYLENLSTTLYWIKQPSPQCDE